ncbi:MAG: SDR family oxidoreductase [Desulforegulaceae bacterium]|nr:SDR family oxidoreductase [Desulforegulaceae bacterium]
MKNYFITGSTGSVGSEVVKQLIKDKEVNFYLLIFAKNDADLKRKTQQVYNYWKIKDKPDELKRFFPLKGDIRLNNFGLSDSDYEMLTDNCTHIIHCAGNVRMNLDILEAKKYSVNSAQSLVELTRKCLEKGVGFKKSEFISTVGVGGRIRGAVPETWITDKREFHNTYEEAKADAEDYIRKNCEKYDLPITVHRPSMVVGNSADGSIIHFQIFYHLCEFLSGKRTSGITTSTGSTKLDTIPVDYVAKAIIWSSTTDITKGRILHECSGPEKSIYIYDLRKKVQKAFVKKGIKIPKTIFIPSFVFKSLLPMLRSFVPKEYKNAIKTLPVFLDYLEGEQSFSNEKTVKLLSEYNIDLPFPENYLDNVLNCYLDKN